MKIVWDERKRQINLAKHGFDFADLTVSFFETAKSGAVKAGRLIAVGGLHGQPVIAVVFVPPGTEAISIVSMRPASRKERRPWLT